MISIQAPSGQKFTSQIGPIRIETSHESLLVELLFAKSAIGAPETVHSTRLYAYGGAVTLYEADALLEEQMRAAEASAGYITVRATGGDESATAVFSAIYSAGVPFAGTDSAEWLKRNFLTVSRYRHIPPGMPLTAYVVFGDGDERRVHVAGSCREKRTGARLNFSGDMTVRTQLGAGPVVSVGMAWPQLQSMAASSTGRAASEFDIVSVILSCGERAIYFYVDSGLSCGCEIFAFMSAFNLAEYICVNGARTDSTDIQAESASLMGELRQYDRKVTRTMKLDIDVFTLDDADLLRDLAASHSIRKAALRTEASPATAEAVDEAGFMDVAIIESKLDFSRHEAPSTFELTYRFTSARTLDESAIGPASIFSRQYNHNFS